jgi:hypothetical protein
MTAKDSIHHRLERKRGAVGEQLGQQAAQRRRELVRDRGGLRLGPADLRPDLRRPKRLAECLQDERPARRDVALYLRDPHVVLSYAPQDLFLDPSHTFRLWLERYQFASAPARASSCGCSTATWTPRPRTGSTPRAAWCRRDPEFIWEQRASRVLHYWVAEDEQDGAILGVVNGRRSREAFGDYEGGASLWALAWMPRRPIRASARPWCARSRSSTRPAAGPSWTCR